MTDKNHQLLQGFIGYWTRERQPPELSGPTREIAFDSFMAGATCVLEKILGGEPPTEDEMLEMLDQLARETGEHMSRRRVSG
jgi:hypothetical protein